MRILVTGGTGYIGSVLVPELLAAGHAVHVLDTMRHGQGFTLAACCSHPNFEFTLGDARNDPMLEPLVDWAKAIIPLAALVGAPLCARLGNEAWDINTYAIETITRLAGDRPIIYPNTNSCYGTSVEVCTETSDLKPLSVYATTKQVAENVIRTAPNGVALRLATVFGMSPRMRLDLLVNDFVHRALRDRSVTLFEAHHRRNYVHVRDVARAFLHALNNVDMMRGKAYNVGLPDANLSKAQLCEAIAEAIPGFTWNEASIGVDPDQRDYIVSSDRIMATGFRFKHDLPTGIRELVKGLSMLRGGQYGNV